MSWKNGKRKPSKYKAPREVEAICSNCSAVFYVSGSAWKYCKGIYDKPKCRHCAAPIFLRDSKSVERYVGMTPLRKYFNEKATQAASSEPAPVQPTAADLLLNESDYVI